jgi:hypothetical protein
MKRHCPTFTAHHSDKRKVQAKAINLQSQTTIFNQQQLKGYHELNHVKKNDNTQEGLAYDIVLHARCNLPWT